MKAISYAEALYGALKGEKGNSDASAKKILTHFRKVVASRGHEKLLPFIARELEKILAREKDKNEVLLVTANTKSLSKWSHAYDHYIREGIIPKNATRTDVVDESIIGGFQIRAKGTLIDGSYKKSLVDLYRQITN